MDEALGILTGLVQSGVLPILFMLLRIAVLVMAMYVVWRCYTSFRKGLRRRDPVIMLVNHDAKLKYPILYWENSIGRSKSCDIILQNGAVSRDHAVLMRRDEGWIICDTDSKEGVYVNGKKIENKRVLNLGDNISIGGNSLTLLNTDQTPQKKQRVFRGFSSQAASPFKLMLVTTLVHVLMAVQLAFNHEPLDIMPFIYCGIITVIGWTLFGVSSFALRRVSFELETVGLLLSGIGVLLLSGFAPDRVATQFAALIIGVVIFCFIIWFIADLDRVAKFRYPVAAAALLVFVINLLTASVGFGAKNWIKIGGMSLQPSELIKIAFIFFGASTLEKLQTKKNITEFLVFTAGCLIFLFVMRDFGTALIYFATFLIVAFMRSGSFRTIILVLAAAVLGLILILKFMPYVVSRFEIWGNVWTDPQGKGYQQTRMLTYFASGGLVGVGIGNGFLHRVEMSESDLTFGIVGEEMGILMAFLLVAAIALFCFYSRSDVTRSRSTFYSITSCAAAGLLLFQTCLHVFGQADILPFTGVTFPFVTVGGSSMMSVWGMLAFMKASDERTYAARRMTRKQIRESEERARQERALREQQRRSGGEPARGTAQGFR